MKYLIAALILVLASCSERQAERSPGKSQIETIGIDTSGLTGWFYVADSGLGTPIDSTPILTAAHFDTVEIFHEPSSGNRALFGLKIVLDQDGAQRFLVATKKAMGKQLAFLLFGRMVMAPTVQGTITNGRMSVYLDEYYTLKELEEVKAALQDKRH